MPTINHFQSTMLWAARIQAFELLCRIGCGEIIGPRNGIVNTFPARPIGLEMLAEFVEVVAP